MTLSEDSASSAAVEPDVLDVDAALEELAALDERQARLVELRFFGGLEHRGGRARARDLGGHREPRLGDGQGVAVPAA